MFRLAHISDIHLGPLPKLSLAELASKRVTGYVNWHRHRRKHMFGTALEEIIEALAQCKLDHVAITGDLVNLATSIEIETASRWLETNFLPEKCTLVPGNHDAYVPGAFAHISRAWLPWILSGHTHDHATGEKKQLFPTFAERGPIALIGLSTANASLPFMATGDFSASQASAAGKLLVTAREKGLFRIVLIHHPPIRNATGWHKRLKGVARFEKMIRTHGAELILHGHTHLDTVHTIQTPSANVPVVGIASASQSPGGKRPNAAFNLFEISGRQGDWKLDHQRISLRDNAEGTEVNLVAPRLGTLAIR